MSCSNRNDRELFTASMLSCVVLKLEKIFFIIKSVHIIAFSVIYRGKKYHEIKSGSTFYVCKYMEIRIKQCRFQNKTFFLHFENNTA